MSTFVDSNAVPVSKPDPSRHVNYVQGMILGVDDFIQEFTYLSGRDQWMTRDLLGYGTVCGLQVSVKEEERNGDEGQWVHVAPGTAVNPQGQMIRVKSEQCANLNKWVEKNKDEIAKRMTGSPPADHLKLYIVLCYRECPTDNVPIPGEPCRSEESLMAPSRRQDDFVLELRLDPPEQYEENALRCFIKWLRSTIEITVEQGSPPNGSGIEEFETAIRNAVCSVTSPPSSQPEFMCESPPVHFAIPSSKVCEYLRAALRVWVTELRPKWRDEVPAQGEICRDASDKRKEEDANCVLLAELDVPLKADGSVGGIVSVNEEKRPYLLHSRMLQELLMCGTGYSVGVDSETSSPGMIGPQGPTGDKGPQGDKGPDGDKGPKGDKGSAGDKGPQGDKGLQGDKGPSGDKGPQGEKGPKGDKGSAGDKGPQGDKGLQGDKGPSGDSFIIAAGCFDLEGKATPLPYFSYEEDLTATKFQNPNLPYIYVLTFKEYDPKVGYVVKGTCLSTVDNKVPQFFEVILEKEIGAAIKAESDYRREKRIPPLPKNRGILIRVAPLNNERPGAGFMVEISAFGKVE